MSYLKFFYCWITWSSFSSHKLIAVNSPSVFIQKHVPSRKCASWCMKNVSHLYTGYATGTWPLKTILPFYFLSRMIWFYYRYPFWHHSDGIKVLNDQVFFLVSIVTVSMQKRNYLFFAPPQILDLSRETTVIIRESECES